MKIENYLAKFFDVNTVETDKYVTRVEIYEKGEDCEPIGYFVKLVGLLECDTYQYRNVYGKQPTGRAFTAATLKTAAKSGAFL